MLGFVGPFGDSNYGDYAMFVNDVYSLNVRKFVVFSYNNSLIKSLQETYLAGYDISCCEVEVSYDYNETYSGQYHVEYDLRAYTPYEIIKLISNKTSVWNQVEQIDTLVVCGGGYFNHIWNANHRKSKLFSILGTILIAAMQKKKIVFMGNTFGPFNESADLFASFFASLHLDFIASRDSLFSVNELRKIGYAGEVKCIPDDLYFLNSKFQTPGTRAIQDKYIIWECYCSIDEINENLDLIKTFVKTMEQRHGAKVVFLPLDKKYGGEYQGKLVSENVDDIILIPLDHGFVHVEALNDLVRNAELVICHRYHLFLTALTHNTPCINVMKTVCGDFRYYYCKIKGLLEQVFSNQIFDEELFIHDNMWNALEYVSDSIEHVCLGQKALFNDKKIQAESAMLQTRNEYLQNITGELG